MLMGLSAPILGKYYHSSSFELNLVDATFDLQYLALNVGGSVTIGGEAITDESVITTVADEITVSGTPKDFGGVGVIGWMTPAGQDNWQKIEFTGKTAKVSNLPAGTTVCVRYNEAKGNMREFIVPSSIIPAECHAILTASLFSADSKNFTASSKVAELVIDIPRFQLSGAQEFTMNMTGASTSNLAGSALVNYDTVSCTDSGYYARIKEIRYSGTVYDDIQTMAVNDAEIEMKVGDSRQISVIGIYNGGATGNIPAADLTFTSATTSVADIDNDGKITAKTTGDTLITIELTSNPEITCYAQVTVTATGI